MKFPARWLSFPVVCRFSMALALAGLLGCRPSTPDAEPSPSGLQADRREDATKDAPKLPQDSFQLAIDDVRPRVTVAKRQFVITVPSSAKHIGVYLGQVEGAPGWYLAIEPSRGEERVCSFEVSEPVAEPRNSHQVVTVIARLSTPRSTSESPMTFASEEQTALDDVVSFSVKPGLFKQNAPVVLGLLKLGTDNPMALTLYVWNGDPVTTKELP